MLKVLEFLRLSLFGSWVNPTPRCGHAPSTITDKTDLSGRVAKKRRLKGLKRRRKKIYSGRN